MRVFNTLTGSRINTKKIRVTSNPPIVIDTRKQIIPAPKKVSHKSIHESKNAIPHIKLRNINQFQLFWGAI